MGESRMQHAVGSTGHAMQVEMTGGGEQGTRSRVEPALVDTLIDSWPEVPAKMARTTVEKYCPPNEATETGSRGTSVHTCFR